MPGWEGSNRKAELPADWPAIRRRIMARDGHACTWLVDGRRCNDPATDVDHIKRGNNHDDSNLRALCRPHHHKKSSAEGGTAARRRTRKYRVNRPAERHPGIRPAD